MIKQVKSSQKMKLSGENLQYIKEAFDKRSSGQVKSLTADEFGMVIR
jgi:hypothetical protein